MLPIALPPWALDPARGECTTLVLLAPAPTQFLVQVHPWEKLPRAFSSSAGAVQLTRCGRERPSLLGIMLELRSPRAVVHTLVAVGPAPPAPLVQALPERATGPAAELADPGPPLPRAPLAKRLELFELAAQQAGASSVEVRPVPGQGTLRVTLEPGCHRLLSAAPDGAPSPKLAVQEGDQGQPRELEPSDAGDARDEVCTARERVLALSSNLDRQAPAPQLAIAHFPLPLGLPGRFGPEVAESLTRALGGSRAPRRLGPLVTASLGAQGHTPLPRRLLPGTCYLAALTLLHGSAAGVSLGVRSGARSAQASSETGDPGPRLSFCTGKDAQVELDVEARGLGLAWLFFLFQVGPAAPEAGP